MASSHIQRWAIILSTYSYTIRYKPGTHVANADALSRLPLPDKLDSVPVPADVQQMLNHLSECIIHVDQIKKLTDQDPTLSLMFEGLLKLVI